ncbi:MAG: DoxX family protein [Chloroflexi bacterium]|nr:DoxX family protein [Chloroflexota bacterium]MDL1944103.1 DoxX family protein [Chloroflexi bacterium CFX2]
MDIAFLIGRIVVGLYWLYGAYAHFTQPGLAAYAEAKGVPFGGLAVRGTGLLLLFGGLSILTGVQPILAILALTVFLLPVTLWMHNFWTVQDPEARETEFLMFTKNIAMLGYTLILLAIPQPWIFSLGF